MRASYLVGLAVLLSFASAGAERRMTFMEYNVFQCWGWATPTTVRSWLKSNGNENEERMGNAMNRRGFIEGAAACGLFAGCTTESEKFVATRGSVPGRMWGFLIHLGTKMWPRYAADARLEIDRSVWDAVTERMAAKGLNTLIIDLGEGLRYPSHPELGTVGSWEPEQMREEIARLRKMGILAVPKLNFSSSHDLWLGEARLCLSTPDYYRVCADVIRDVAAVFDESPLFHLGWDEETVAIQGRADKFPLMRLRQGDLWWHDFLFTVGEVERVGMRPWIWSDYCWHHPETFLKRMPKSVLQSNWYYGRDLSLAHLKEVDSRSPSLGGPRVNQVGAFRLLEEAGFDQVPCGSTYRENGFQTQNFPAIVRHCREVVAPERLKGFLMAPWLVETGESNRTKLLASVDNVAEALALK